MPKPLTNEEGEVRELTLADMEKMRPVAEVLPELAALLPQRRPDRRGPAKRPTGEPVNLRLDPEIVRHFKADGPGWQSRINDALLEVVRKAS